MKNLIKMICKNYMWKKLQLHFEEEDDIKEILLNVKNKEQMELVQEMMQDILEERKNLYIYPAKDNV